MSNQGWYSMNDVLKDLRKATGLRGRVHNLDEGSFLVGNQPPPQPVNEPDEDAELQMFHLGGSRRPSAREFIGKPDLPGITQMLRMVDDLTEEEPKTPPKKIKSPTTSVLSISKLNPNVNEFIPKSSAVSNKTTQDKTDDIICDSFNLGPIDKNKLTEEQIKKIKQNLITKISVTSKETCVKVKRERNLAIASLVKLYCVPQPTDEEKPKLLVPAYFEKSNLAEKKTTEKVGTEKSIDAQNPTEDSPNKGPKAELSAEKVEAMREAPDPSIAESVDKVQKWLHDSENAGSTTKNPKNNIIKNENVVVSKINGQKEPSIAKKAPYIGAVTFKRKASSKPISPTSTDSNECVKTSKPRAYKPTKYAEELRKTYMEKKKLNEAKQQAMMDPWTKVEAELRAKDQEMLNKKAELNVQPEVSME
ncbi:uncharacterized protein [Maniola hyperantus]|uniref:uncharacterized protein n=1 Tax=Aphantopus hyperantus TaxID=2795564 RepID=UPI00156A3561|nr:muscle M-line assembly protein unc-89-like [Maniola hyperantus]